MTEPLLAVENLVKYFPAGRKTFLGRSLQQVHAVDGVSFELAPGETLGLVGESGCGKSTVSRLAVGLLHPTAGTVRFAGQDIFSLRHGAMRRLRRNFQIVFQDAFSALDPRFTARQLIAEPLVIARVPAAERRRRVEQLIAEVGLRPAHLDRYPHEFSGGQRQRLGIARALALEPRLLVLDEPVSALDVSVQAQIINLLMDLQQTKNLTYIFVSHDLSVVHHIATRVAVMYLGQLVEIAPTQTLFASPRHPYSQALISAVPRIRPEATQHRIVLTGDVPSPITPPTGCRFHTRCPRATDICRTTVPPMTITGDRRFACHHPLPAAEPP